MKKIIIVILIALISSQILKAQQYQISYKFIKSNKKTDSFKLDISYPVISGYINSSNEDILNNKIQDFINDNINYIKEMSEESNITNFKNYLNIDFKIMYATDNFISIRFESDIYTGGAHGMQPVYTINYNFVNGIDFSLNDILKINSLKYIAKYCREYLINSLRSPYEPTINEGTKPNIDNYGCFNILQDAIVVVFQNYQVCSYAEGIQYVYISNDEIIDYLKDKHFFEEL